MSFGEIYKKLTEDSVRAAVALIRAFSAAILATVTVLLWAGFVSTWYTLAVPVAVAVVCYAIAGPVGSRLGNRKVDRVLKDAAPNVGPIELSNDEKVDPAVQQYGAQLAAASEAVRTTLGRVRSTRSVATHAHNACVLMTIVGLMLSFGPHSRALGTTMRFVGAEKLFPSLNRAINEAYKHPEDPKAKDRLANETTRSAIIAPAILKAVEPFRELQKVSPALTSSDKDVVIQGAIEELAKVNNARSALQELKSLGALEEMPQAETAEKALNDFSKELQKAANGQVDASALKNAAEKVAEAGSKFIQSLLDLLKEIFSFLDGIMKGLGSGLSQQIDQAVNSGKGMSQGDANDMYEGLQTTMNNKPPVVIPTANPPKPPKGPQGTISGPPRVTGNPSPNAPANRKPGDLGGSKTNERLTDSTGDKSLIPPANNSGK